MKLLDTPVGPIEILFSTNVPVGKWVIFTSTQNGNLVQMHPVDGWVLWRQLNPWLTAAV